MRYLHGSSAGFLDDSENALVALKGKRHLLGRKGLLGVGLAVVGDEGLLGEVPKCVCLGQA